jgi:uncharacterized membrane protein
MSGAVSGFFIGAAITNAGAAHTTAFLGFFIIASLVTKYAERKKGSSKEKTARDAYQAFANGGVPALICILQGSLSDDWELIYFAYLACCFGDTLASELGSLSSIKPRFILTFQPVRYSSTQHACMHACMLF